MTARKRCEMQIDFTPRVGRAPRSVRGLTTGQPDEVCALARFKSYHEREIRRLFIKTIQKKADAISVVREVCGSDLMVREHLVGIGVDADNRIRGIADGSSNEKSICRFNVGDLLAAVFRSRETSSGGKAIVKLVIGHNHPGGDATPSPADIRSTKSLAVEACKLAGIRLVEHVIVTAPEIQKPWPDAKYFFSMREEYGEAVFGEDDREC